jgi:hypothetical protein
LPQHRRLGDPVSGRDPDTIRDTYRQYWKRVFGVPRVVVVDQERSFAQGLFPRLLAIEGTEVRVTSARSPWQNGRTERAGGLWETVCGKVCKEVLLTDQNDFEEAVDATSVACL